MGFLAFGILMIVVGVILAFTNVLGLGGLGDSFVWVGWICLGIGIILAILHFVMGPRRTVVERETRRTI